MKARSLVRDVPFLLAAGLTILVCSLPAEVITGPRPRPDPLALDTGLLILRLAVAGATLLLILGHRLRPAGGGPTGGATPAWRPATLLFLLALGVRLIRLDRPLWFDEIWMLTEYVRGPIGALFREFPNDNNHPLYTLLAWCSVRALGESAAALRLPAVAFGAGSVALLFLYARNRFHPRVACTAAGVLALAYHPVWFSQNARGYTGLLFFTLLSSHCFLRALETAERRWWLGHAVALALCTYVHLTGVLVAAGHLVWLLAVTARGSNAAGARGRWAGLLGLGLAGLLSLSLYALVLPQMLHFLLHAPPRVADSVLWKRPHWFVVETARSLGPGVGPGLAILVGGGLVAVLGLVRTARRSAATVVFLLIPALLGAISFVALHRNLWPRFFFFLAGFGLLVVLEGGIGAVRAVAARLGERTRERLATAACGLLLLAALATLPRAFALPKQDFEGARRWIEAHAGPGERVVTIGLATLPYRDYYEAGFDSAEDLSGFLDLLPPGGTAYVLSTLPAFVIANEPDLWEYVQRNGVEAARFPGSLGGGDVVIYRVSR